MLGEAARTFADGERYFASYLDAIEQTGAGHSISVKLSALHPRYEVAHWDRCVPMLCDLLETLCVAAARRGIALTVDAEESERLEMSLAIISKVARLPALKDWDGFGMAAHNYDGDMLTDEVAQVHRSPGFITSNLVGKKDDGTIIKEFEASHGTVADLWHAHLRKEETSMNPLGMVEALLGALSHAAELQKGPELEQMKLFVKTLRSALHNTFRYGQGTRDMSGPSGLTTEQFIDKVAWRLGRYVAADEEHVEPQVRRLPPSAEPFYHESSCPIRIAIYHLDTK
jgi:hypothetical protein